MRSSLAVMGTVLAIGGGGCGDLPPQQDPANLKAAERAEREYDSLTPLQREIGAVVIAGAHADSEHGFAGIDPADFQDVFGGELRLRHGRAAINVMSDRTERSVDDDLTELYLTVQDRLIEQAEATPSLELSVFDTATKKQTGKININMNVISSKSILVFPKENDFPEKYGEAFTLSPRHTKRLTRPVSFVLPLGNTINEATSIGVEACQAKIDVSASDRQYDDEERGNIAAQELFCNSWGFAHTLALNKTSYAVYRLNAKRLLGPGFKSADGKHELLPFIFSEKMYENMANGQPIEDLSGVEYNQN